MRRVMLAVLALALAATIGGFLAFEGDRIPLAPTLPHGEPAAAERAENAGPRRPSAILPREAQQRRDAVESDSGDPAGSDGQVDRFRVLVTIRDEFGRPVPATVIVRASEAELELARGVAAANGVAQIDVRGGPRAIVLRVAADGHETVEQEIVPSPGEALIDQIVLLHTNDSVLLTGLVRDERGLPIDPELFGLIGPEHEDDPAYEAMALGLCGTPRIIAYRTGAGRHADALVTDLESTSGAFELELPAGFDGEVALVFGEQPLATEHWRAGMGPVVLTVPRERLLRASGTLVVEVVDERGAPVLSGSVGIALDRFSFEDEPMLQVVDVDLPEDGKPLVLERVPAVRFRVSARPADASLAGAAASVEIDGGASTTVRLVVARGADIRLWFVSEDANESMSGAEDLRCIVASGLEIPVIVDDAFSAQWRGAQVRGLPSGHVAFQHDGNVLVLDLQVGQNADEQWRVAEPQAFTVLFTSPLARDASELDTLRVRFELWTEAGFPALREFEEPEWVGEHDAQFVEWVAPGTYRLMLDCGIAEPMESEVVIRRSESDVVVDLR